MGEREQPDGTPTDNKQSPLARLLEDLGHSPVVSNVVFGFLLALVERVLEVEFACPCNPKWNRIFGATFFVVPALIAFLLMLIIHGYTLPKCRFPKQRPKCRCSILPLLFPPLVWQVLVFIDGQYLVCVMTYWTGTFISVDKSYLKWCTPTNSTTLSPAELLDYSHRMFICSQGTGFGLLIVLFLLVLVYLFQTWWKKRDKSATEPEALELNPGP